MAKEVAKRIEVADVGEQSRIHDPIDARIDMISNPQESSRSVVRLHEANSAKIAARLLQHADPIVRIDGWKIVQVTTRWRSARTIRVPTRRRRSSAVRWWNDVSEHPWPSEIGREE